MASFKPEYGPTNDPVYTNVKEYTPSDFRSIAEETNAAKDKGFFDDLAQTIQSGVKAVDTYVKEGIKQDVYEGVDKLRGAQGVDLAATQAGAAGEPLNLDKGGNPNARNPLAGNRPPNPDVIQEGMGRLQAAYEQGKISDTNYYAQLEAMTRSLRSRYPGYREEVDAMVHSVTGITPANALRNSIISDLKASEAQKVSAEKDFRHFVTSKAEFLPPDYYDRLQQGKPYSEVETRAYVFRMEQRDHQVKAANAALELEAKQGKNVEEKARTVAQEGVASLNTQVLSQVQPFLEKIIQEQSQGKVYTAEEQNQLKANAASLRTKTQLLMEKYFNQELTPGSGKTLGSMVKPEDKKAIIEGSMKIFDMVDQHLFDKDKGVLNTALNTVKAMQEGTHLEIMKKYPVIQAMEAIGSTPGGSKVLADLAGSPQTGVAKALNTSIQSLFNSMALHDLTGGKNLPDGPKSITDQLNDFISSPEGKKPANLKGLIESKAVILSNPAIPVAQKAEAAKALFSNPNSLRMMEKFDSGSRLQVFQSLVSPSVVQEMTKVKTADPQAWEAYSTWSKNAFVSVYRSAGASVGKAWDSAFWKVGFNEKSHQFELSPTPEGIKFLNQAPMGSIVGFTATRALGKALGGDVQSYIDNLNKGIRTIMPVLEANGFDTNQEVKNLTNFLSKYDSKNPGFWQWLLPQESEDKPIEKETFGGVHPNFTQASGDNPRGLLSLDPKAPDASMEALKGAFSRGESGDNYNRLVGGSGTPKEASLTKMTVGEVLAYQKDMISRGHLSTAAGKYQIIKGTLQSLIDEGVVKPEDKYDEDTQERLADALLERRGLSKFLSGKLPIASFLKNLGDEWEILKKSPEAYHKTMAALMELRRTQTASN